MGLSLGDVSDVSWWDPALIPEGPDGCGKEEDSPLAVGWPEHTVTSPTLGPGASHIGQHKPPEMLVLQFHCKDFKLKVKNW